MTYEDRYDSAWSGTGYDDTDDFEDSHETTDSGATINKDRGETEIDTTHETDHSATGGMDVEDAALPTYLDQREERDAEAAEAAYERDEARGLHDNYRGPIDWLRRSDETRGAAVLAAGLAAVAFVVGGR